jgi:hypothetical protein
VNLKKAIKLFFSRRPVLLIILKIYFCSLPFIISQKFPTHSRSFADQFYIDKVNYAHHLKKNLVVSNANDEVMHMLHAVAKTQQKKMNTSISIPVYKYSSQIQLDDFLLSI